VPEVRRLVLAMAEGREGRAFRIGWSVWRRAHQAVAARCHAVRRARKRDGPSMLEAVASPAAERAALTDGEWELVRALRPPQRPAVGRPRHDHRTVLGGILWVVRTRSSWRDMPSAFGKWETAYKRYRLWRDTGLRHGIAATLGIDGAHHPAEVAL
jgi:Putative transposase of IS4/5 family (DUF4096)